MKTPKNIDAFQFLLVLGLEQTAAINIMQQGKYDSEIVHYLFKFAEHASLNLNFDLYKRMPELEPYIMYKPEVAEFYARDFMKGRWPEAEPYIINDPMSAYFYARDVIQARWPFAELAIKHSPEAARCYSTLVMKERWPEAECYIMKDHESWDRYCYYWETHS